MYSCCTSSGQYFAVWQTWHPVKAIFKATDPSTKMRLFHVYCYYCMANLSEDWIVLRENFLMYDLILLSGIFLIVVLFTQFSWFLVPTLSYLSDSVHCAWASEVNWKWRVGFLSRDQFSRDQFSRDQLLPDQLSQNQLAKRSTHFLYVKVDMQWILMTHCDSNWDLRYAGMLVCWLILVQHQYTSTWSETSVHINLYSKIKN